MLIDLPHTIRDVNTTPYPIFHEWVEDSYHDLTSYIFAKEVWNKVCN